MSSRQELALCKLALLRCNVSKLTATDVPIFLDVVETEFPEPTPLDHEHERLEEALIDVCNTSKKAFDKELLARAFQTYDMLTIRTGVMLLGPAASGKTTLRTLLQMAVSKMDIESGESAGGIVTKVNKAKIEVEVKVEENGKSEEAKAIGGGSTLRDSQSSKSVNDMMTNRSLTTSRSIGNDNSNNNNNNNSNNNDNNDNDYDYDNDYDSRRNHQTNDNQSKQNSSPLYKDVGNIESNSNGHRPSLHLPAPWPVLSQNGASSNERAVSQLSPSTHEPLAEAAVRRKKKVQGIQKLLKALYQHKSSFTSSLGLSLGGGGWGGRKKEEERGKKKHGGTEKEEEREREKEEEKDKAKEKESEQRTNSFASPSAVALPPS
eukprot:CAMPEP_0175065416 /NCGR_PEP_ID=MMETSP0052_2-20121109/15911_1 /TAXON_ID=51329 ORGANISM="Polytomella parva, Strain SAG 63-3" /NCGR_SAMPLE_ID=MMETSP0052_2 /ASSEMBLY_ACC=CAM_ASM_000194 /LENGTH=376 /DNA_ID=CAMNT_0016331945 /DNA_START=45 /DNA_END=1173 /DNA_ORIENTATION=-